MGPGASWANASPSRNSSLFTQPRRSTSSRCIYPTSAIGPPKPVVPSQRKYAQNRGSETESIDLAGGSFSNTHAPLFFRVGLVEGRAEAVRQFRSIIVSPEMHEEESGFFIQHVTMQGSHQNAILPKYLDHGIDFAPKQNEVAGNRGTSAARGLEVDSSRYAHRRRGLHVMLANGFGTCHRKLVNAAVIFSFAAQCLVNGI